MVHYTGVVAPWNIYLDPAAKLIVLDPDQNLIESNIGTDIFK
jgi:hypothetical protein